LNEQAVQGPPAAASPSAAGPARPSSSASISRWPRRPGLPWSHQLPAHGPE